MKKILSEFIRRGLSAAIFGPMVLVVLYLILQHGGAIDSLSVNQVCTGILSLSALAFVAGGMNVIYQIERLPLMMAILIHGGVLYWGYLATYLLNGWLDGGATPILVFTGIFLLGYLAVWAVIYCITRRNTEKLNALLREKQQNSEDLIP